MKLTKTSKLLLSFFMDNNCIFPAKQTKQTKDILNELYNEIKDAELYINALKKEHGDFFYNVQFIEITTSKQIPKPKTFPVDGFPEPIRKHIDEEIINLITYSVYLLDRRIKIHFLTEENNAISNVHIYNNYVDNMLIWLIIINQYTNKNCVHELTIYLYFTSLKKNIPYSNISILGEYNVNTAFTMTCPTISEIVIFRKEEWFKVFLHETFHNFALDFSDMNNDACNKRILNLFPVKSEVNLYESYAEFWAKIMNALFCSYHTMTNKSNIQEFYTNAIFFINFERFYSCFQMVKVLQFMNLKYNNLYDKNNDSAELRNTLYREDTNVLAYYVICCILLSDYQSFMIWCNTNNINILQFKKTISNQNNLCDFILKKYKNSFLLDNIDCIEYLIKQMKNNHGKKRKSSQNKYILENLRMSICELG